jgi:hypothetical protein
MEEKTTQGSQSGAEVVTSPEAEERDFNHPEIVKGLGDLPEGAIVTETGLAEMLGRHPVSVKRAVKRGEFPPPVRLLGQPVWTAGTLVRHLEGRLEAARKELEKEKMRLARHSV